jgi:hypothetical protein
MTSLSEGNGQDPLAGYEKGVIIDGRIHSATIYGEVKAAAVLSHVADP